LMSASELNILAATAAAAPPGPYPTITIFILQYLFVDLNV
jgi:hypothetical protein